MTNQAVKKGYIPSSDKDELQPQYVFGLTHTELLVAIAQGLIDPVELAKNELKNRGLDMSGKWVGFTKK